MKSQQEKGTISIRSALFLGIALILGVSLAVTSTSFGSRETPASSSSSLQFSTLPPKSPSPATNIYVVRPNGGLQFTITALQGLVARSSPQIFVETQSDAFWLNYTAKTYHLDYQVVKQTDLLLQFKTYAENSQGKVQLVIFDSNDPIAPSQEDMAVTIAGVRNALPVASSELSTVEGIFGSSNVLIVADLRSVNNGGEFTDKVSAFQWLWDNYGSLTSKSIVGLNPGSWQMSDYLVEWKAFVFAFEDTSAITATESNLANTILSTYPQNTFAFGYFELGGEDNTIAFLSPHQILMVPDSQVSDLSLYSGLPTVSLQQVAPRTLTYDSSKTYVVFSFSQGNALGFDYNTNLQFWQAIDPNTNMPYREEIPSTFQTNPILAEIAPPVIQYWYSTMYSDDSFVAGSTAGGGYSYPDMFPNMASWFTITSQLDSNVDLQYVQISLHSSFRASTAVYQAIVSNLFPQAMFTRQKLDSPPTNVSGVPLFHSTFNVGQRGYTTVSGVVSAIEAASANGNHFIFVFLDSENDGYPFIQQILQDLNSNFVPVSATELTSLYHQGTS